MPLYDLCFTDRKGVNFLLLGFDGEYLAPMGRQVKAQGETLCSPSSPFTGAIKWFVNAPKRLCAGI